MKSDSLCDLHNDCYDNSDKAHSSCSQSNALVVMFFIMTYILIITLVESVFQCDFEQSMCGFPNDENNDDFDWTLARGSTSSFQTGPETDHTTGDSNG